MPTVVQHRRNYAGRRMSICDVLSAAAAADDDDRDVLDCTPAFAISRFRQDAAAPPSPLTRAGQWRIPLFFSTGGAAA